MFPLHVATQWLRSCGPIGFSLFYYLCNYSPETNGEAARCRACQRKSERWEGAVMGNYCTGAVPRLGGSSAAQAQPKGGLALMAVSRRTAVGLENCCGAA